MESKDYFKELKEMERNVCKEIEEALAKLNLTFTDEDENPLEFFNYKDTADNDISAINPDGTVLRFGTDLVDIYSLVDDVVIPLADAISLLDELNNRIANSEVPITMPTFEIKITGSGTIQQLKKALKEVIRSLEDAEDQNYWQLDKAEWEDETLLTKVTREE